MTTNPYLTTEQADRDMLATLASLVQISPEEVEAEHRIERNIHAQVARICRQYADGRITFSELAMGIVCSTSSMPAESAERVLRILGSC